MSGEFIFALLNPALFAILALTFLMLWRIRPAQKYLGILALSFLFCGLAFVANDFFQTWEGPALRVLVNLLFLASAGALCVSALVRVDAPVPTTTFIGAVLVCAVLFLWFLLVMPSTEARIYIANSTLAVMGAATIWQLDRAGPKSAVDWLFVGLGGLFTALALARPLTALAQAVDINPNGSLQASDYWATVQAITPVLGATAALAFFAGWTARALSDVRAEAERDHLTGLMNRRGFDRSVTAALDGPDSRRSQPAVMVIDIDNFKQVNDTFGHIIGDRVIAAGAKVLAMHGNTRIVGRIGGEEFGLFYLQSTRGELLAIAESVRTAIRRVQVEGVPADYPLSISIGIHMRHQSEALIEMVGAADKALYQAKAQGKDRAVMSLTPLKVVVAG